MRQLERREAERWTCGVNQGRLQLRKGAGGHSDTHFSQLNRHNVHVIFSLKRVRRPRSIAEGQTLSSNCSLWRWRWWRK